MEKEQEQEQKLQGWADVTLTEDLPLTVLIRFLNILNQRLCTVENILTVPYEDKTVTLTEFYRIQTEKEEAAKAEAAQNSTTNETTHN